MNSKDAKNVWESFANLKFATIWNEQEVGKFVLFLSDGCGFQTACCHVFLFRYRYFKVDPIY